MVEGDNPRKPSQCDKDGNNIFVFNLRTSKWAEQYDPNLEYLVPDPVVKVIGGRWVYIIQTTVCTASENAVLTIRS